LKTVPGIRAIVVGGSRARGSEDLGSDTALGLYYDPQYPLAVEALDQVVAQHDDRKQSGLVTAIGGWGPWINGGGWLQIDGAAVDLLYRETAQVESVVRHSIGALLMVLFALNRVYWLNEKGALRFTDRFQIVPARFRERVERMWESVRLDPDSLGSALGIARELNEEVVALVEQERLSA